MSGTGDRKFRLAVAGTTTIEAMANQTGGSGYTPMPRGERQARAETGI